MRQTLHKGDTIMIISPAWFCGEERTYPMEAYLSGLGFEVETHPQCFERWGQFAGTVEERVAGIHEAFMDENIQGIVCAGGGYGCLQLLDNIDYSIIQNNPKVFMGYSDITALLGAFYKKAGLIGYHGPMGCFMTYKEDALTTDIMKSVLKCDMNEIPLKGDCIFNGVAKGVLLGGNMTVFDQLIGTEYMPLAENIILFLEDTTDEKINELDKKLLHLKHSGFLKQVKGVILGEFDKLQDNKMPFGQNSKELVEKYLPNIPSVMNVKCGHKDTLLTFPYGAPVTLNVGTVSNLIIEK